MVRMTSPSLATQPPCSCRSFFLFPLLVVVILVLVLQSGTGVELEGFPDGLPYGESSADLSSFDAREVYDLGRLDKRSRYGGFRGDLGKRQSGTSSSLRDIGMDSEFFKNLRLKDVLARKGRVSRKFRGDLGKRSFAPVSVKDDDKDNY